MHLLYRILRQNLRPSQLLGFLIANLLGGIIILVGLQAYADFDSFMEAGDGMLKGDQIVISKPVSGLTTLGNLMGLEQGFFANEINELKKHPAVREVGQFTNVRCRVHTSFSLGPMSWSTDMFLESVPDEFLDIEVKQNDKIHGWTADIDDPYLPIILPRNYLNLYNYGYASARQLPQMSEGMATSFPLRLTLIGNRRSRTYQACIVGFSNKINTILAPADFVEKANLYFDEEHQKSSVPSRLLLATDATQGDQSLLPYLAEKGYIIEGNADTIKIQSLVHSILYVIGFIGIVITSLALYLLAICISLLTERNRDRLDSLCAIGYPISTIARPYRLLVLLLDAAVWISATIIATIIYNRFCDFMTLLAPDFVPSSGMMLLVASLIFMSGSMAVHYWLIGHSIRKITNPTN